MTAIEVNYPRIKNVKEDRQFLRDLPDMWIDTPVFRTTVTKKRDRTMERFIKIFDDLSRAEGKPKLKDETKKTDRKRS